MKQDRLVRQDQQEKSAAKGQAPVRRRILVVDEDNTALLMACGQLALLGFNIVGEKDGASGLACLALTSQDNAFAGMLLELDMAVLQQMKERYPSIPVLVMAEARHIEKLRDAVRMGAREYIVKPFDPELFKMKCASAFAEPLSAHVTPCAVQHAPR